MLVKIKSPILGHCKLSIRDYEPPYYIFRVSSLKYSTSIKLLSRSFRKAMEEAEKEYIGVQNDNKN